MNLQGRILLIFSRPIQKEKDTRAALTGKNKRANSEMCVQVKRRPGTEDLPLPHYMSSGSAGMDLMAAIEEPVVLPPGGRNLIPSGISIALPEGYEAQIRPRSGLAVRHGVTLLNTPGTIDSDYRGEIRMILINLGEEPYTINRGDRIAQMVLAPVVPGRWQEVADLPETKRNAGGFGHTGRSSLK